MEPLKAYVLIANRMYNDGIRSALGLSVENHYARPVILHGEFPKFSKYMADNIAWIADMEGEVFTCGAPALEELSDEEKDGSLTAISLEELGKKIGAAETEHLPEDLKVATLTKISLEELGERMREADVIIPYGLPKQTKEPPPACAE